MKKYDNNSRIRNVYAHPIGHDIISKILLQTGRSKKLIENPIMGSLRFGGLRAALGGRFGYGLFDTILKMLNNEPDLPDMNPVTPVPAWWKEAVFYQIYPRSFKDTNGDGIGDLPGIIQKLDYLKNLGIDALWLCPIYDSPCDDNGYDIRDYYKILPEYGTMEDFETLAGELHKRGMKLIMDLVLNHTSDEHKWFKEALADENSPYRDYYFFRRTKDKKPPNNWTSFFGGSAWNYYEEQDIWALHLFSKKQMDLNWDNPALRGELYEIARWWAEKGADGFRLDVINYISKPEDLPDGDPNIGSLMGFTGIEHYFYGPRLGQYLCELREKAFMPYGTFSVGETPGIGMKMARLLTDKQKRRLDLIFSFDHLESPGHTRFDDYVYDMDALKDYYIKTLGADLGHGWDTLFYDNHDNPRMLSKISPGKHRYKAAEMLGVLQMTLRGTPFIYQGQEIGMINKNYQTIDDLRDVESLNLYNELIKTMTPEEAFKKVLSGTRDHARSPMQWECGKNGGFTEGEPWIYGDGDEIDCNVKDQEEIKSSTLNFYRSLIALRRSSKSFIYGTTEYIDKKEEQVMRYVRLGGDEAYYIECNLGQDVVIHKEINKEARYAGFEEKLVLSNYPGKRKKLNPYEARIYKIMKTI